MKYFIATSLHPKHQSLSQLPLASGHLPQPVPVRTQKSCLQTIIPATFPAWYQSFSTWNILCVSVSWGWSLNTVAAKVVVPPCYQLS